MKIKLFSAIVAVMLMSCSNTQSQKNEAEPAAPQLDSIMVSRVEVVKAKLPISDGCIGIEDCVYDGKTVVLRMRFQFDDPNLSSPEMVKWIPSMMLSNIHLLDTPMIKRLVELNQPLTYELYESNDSVLVKKFALSATQLNERAQGSNMF